MVFYAFENNFFNHKSTVRYLKCEHMHLELMVFDQKLA